MTKSKEKKGNKGDKKLVSQPKAKLEKEIGGPKGLEPSRYGDWERKGIVSDF